MIDEKTCTKCGKVFQGEEIAANFYKRTRQHYYAQCNACQKQRAQRSKRKHSDRKLPPPEYPREHAPPKGAGHARRLGICGVCCKVDICRRRLLTCLWVCCEHPDAGDIHHAIENGGHDPETVRALAAEAQS